MATINGTSSDDNLSARSNDTISGLAGNDTLTGSGGQDTFVVRRGDGIDTITDFGGVGTGVRPAPSVIASVDTLKFEGTGLSAKNMLLTQDGSDLQISFAGVKNTQAILKDFDLEDLEDLKKSTGASVNISNILFNGQTQSQDSFDVFNANQNRDKVFNRNTVTFLNDLNNNTQGWNDSNDIINAQGGDDDLQGLSGDDILRGGSDNDILNGGLGIDNLTGGTGDDTYIVDSTTDTIIEYFYEGTDRVQSSVSYTLGNNLENLALTSSSNINGTGNASNNYITGNDANNFLYGRAGNDTLNGSLGIDTLIGGTGDDYYRIEGTSDTVIEYFNEGIDSVDSSFDYILRENSNLENLYLSGSRAITGVGNSLDNRIFGSGRPITIDVNNYLYGFDGNDFLAGYGYFGIDTEEEGDDYLDGGAGNDTLDGGNGNDSLYGGAGNDNLSGNNVSGAYFYNGNDSLEGGTGNDNLRGSVGNDYLAGDDGNDNLDGDDGNDSLEGGTGNDNLRGSVGNDYLAGDDGNDNLDGGEGNDTLTGGAGADKFSFTQPDEGIDTITDFSVVDDTIIVNASYTYVFRGELTTGAVITPTQFVIGSAARDTSDRFIYNQNTGALSFDIDGTGGIGQLQFATLSPGIAMTNADIFVNDSYG